MARFGPAKQHTTKPPRSLKNVQDAYQELQDSNQEIQETLESCRVSQDSQTPTSFTKT